MRRDSAARGVLAASVVGRRWFGSRATGRATARGPCWSRPASSWPTRRRSRFRGESRSESTFGGFTSEEDVPAGARRRPSSAGPSSRASRPLPTGRGSVSRTNGCRHRDHRHRRQRLDPLAPSPTDELADGKWTAIDLDADGSSEVPGRRLLRRPQRGSALNMCWPTSGSCRQPDPAHRPHGRAHGRLPGGRRDRGAGRPRPRPRAARERRRAPPGDGRAHRWPRTAGRCGRWSRQRLEHSATRPSRTGHDLRGDCPASSRTTRDGVSRSTSSRRPRPTSTSRRTSRRRPSPPTTDAPLYQPRGIPEGWVLDYADVTPGGRERHRLRPGRDRLHRPRRRHLRVPVPLRDGDRLRRRDRRPTTPSRSPPGPTGAGSSTTTRSYTFAQIVVGDTVITGRHRPLRPRPWPGSSASCGPSTSTSCPTPSPG